MLSSVTLPRFCLKDVCARWEMVGDMMETRWETIYGMESMVSMRKQQRRSRL